MKLLHTSDWHLGMQAGLGTQAENQRFFFEQLYAIIRAQNVGAVLCAGDVYDTSVASAEAIGLYNEAVTTICGEMKVPFIVIAGNHDSAPRLAACRELLAASGLYVTGRLTRDIAPVLLDGGKTAVYPIPFFNRDEAVALFPERREEIRSQEQAMLAVCDHIREEMDPARRNILLTHALIVNAELSESDRSARVGFATAVSRAVFQGFDYVALGHIHKPQVIAPHIRYSGSPVKYAFGSEESQEKSVILYDTETGEEQVIPLATRHDRKTVEGTYAEICAREDLKEDYLRLRVTDRYAGLELMSDLQTRFPLALEVYGKSLAEGEAQSALSVEALQSLDDMEIMKKFMAEHFQYEPNEDQQALFRAVLAWSEEEAAE